MDFLPADVANSFVRQYYESLAENSELLAKFYGKESTRSHFYGEIQSVANGLDEIKTQLSQLSFKEMTINLEEPIGAIDCQVSINGGVIVTVTGLIGFDKDIPQRFVQTFFLAATAGRQSFWVRNDIFRTVASPESRTVVQSVVPEPVAVSVPAKASVEAPVALEKTAVSEKPVQEAEPTPEIVAHVQVTEPVVESKQAPHNATKQTSKSRRSRSREQNKTRTKQTNTSEMKSEPVKSSVPKSWAQVTAQLKDGQQTSTENVQTASRTRPTKSKSIEKETNGTVSNEEPVHSVFLKGSGIMSTSVDTIADTFAQFGPIRGVRVAKPDQSAVYVDFKTPEAVEKALSRGSITLGEHAVRILQSYGSKPSSDSRRGRGGYRGRGRGRGGRRS